MLKLDRTSFFILDLILVILNFKISNVANISGYEKLKDQSRVVILFLVPLPLKILPTIDIAILILSVSLLVRFFVCQCFE